MPGTPEPNDWLEQKFATLCGQVRSILNGGNFIDSWRGLCAGAANTASLFKNCIIKTGNEKSAFQQLFGTEETKTILSAFQKFGEKFIMMKQQKGKAKLENCVIPCIWLGYTTYMLLVPNMCFT